MDRQRGTVKWFSREKGWGFIQLEGGEDIFVHHSDIIGEGFVTLEDGEAVEFTVEQMEKGPRARKVRSLDETDASRTVSDTGQSGSEVAARAGEHGAARADRAEDEDAVRDEPSGTSGGRRPLAEQLREKLGRHFPGLGS